MPLILLFDSRNSNANVRKEVGKVYIYIYNIHSESRVNIILNWDECVIADSDIPFLVFVSLCVLVLTVYVFFICCCCQCHSCCFLNSFHLSFCIELSFHFLVFTLFGIFESKEIRDHIRTKERKKTVGMPFTLFLLFTYYPI